MTPIESMRRVAALKEAARQLIAVKARLLDANIGILDITIGVNRLLAELEGAVDVAVAERAVVVRASIVKAQQDADSGIFALEEKGGYLWL